MTVVLFALSGMTVARFALFGMTVRGMPELTYLSRAYEKGPLNRVGLSLNWEPGGVLLSHGEAPHYHRR